MGDAASLVARAAAGDAAAFGQIYDLHSSTIYDFCRSILRDDADAADAAHDAFLIAYRKLGDLRDPEKLRPWLYSIARRESLRRIEKRRRASPTESVVEMADDSIDLDDGLREDDAAQLVWEAAEGLSPKDRMVLDLHLRHGLGGEELGEALGVSRQNAYVQLNKMKGALARAAGAYLVVRYRRRDCDELDAVLAGWDGSWNPLIRKRAARHIDSCDVCERHRGVLVAPDKLFSAMPLMVAPMALRQRVMGSVAGEGPPPPAAPRRPWSRHRAVTLIAAAVFVAMVIGVGLVAVLGSEGDGPPAPTVTSTTTPLASVTSTLATTSTNPPATAPVSTTQPPDTSTSSSTTTAAPPTTATEAPTTTAAPSSTTTSEPPTTAPPVGGSGPGMGSG